MNRYQEKLATDVRTDGRTHNHKCTYRASVAPGPKKFRGNKKHCDNKTATPTPTRK